LASLLIAIVCRTAGLPQYGQLGHGEDNEVKQEPLCLTTIILFLLLTQINIVNFQYNSKDSSVRLVYEPQPRPRTISAFSDKTVVKVACGTNHTGLSCFPLPYFI